MLALLLAARSDFDDGLLVGLVVLVLVALLLAVLVWVVFRLVAPEHQSTAAVLAFVLVLVVGLLLLLT